MRVELAVSQSHRTAAVRSGRVPSSFLMLDVVFCSSFFRLDEQS